jgi:methyltransferase
MEPLLDGTRRFYVALVALVAVERVVELVLSRRNAGRLLARGAVEVGRGHYPWMVLAHTLFLFACPLEVLALRRPWIPVLGVSMTLLLAATMALRYWVVFTLGERWCTRVVYLPGEPRIRTGPYRLMRHPNYLAVVLELIALPLIHSAWLTAIVFGAWNAVVLRLRIRTEDEALRPVRRRSSTGGSGSR